MTFAARIETRRTALIAEHAKLVDQQRARQAQLAAEVAALQPLMRDASQFNRLDDLRKHEANAAALVAEHRAGAGLLAIHEAALAAIASGDHPELHDLQRQAADNLAAEAATELAAAEGTLRKAISPAVLAAAATVLTSAAARLQAPATPERVDLASLAALLLALA